ncbi:MAG: ATP-binding cassette domain-containing protein [Ignavibacteria bacterium]|nr:ATP-binding cassette domain-containing protein [Ignavibacteria bacterium]
MTDKPTDIISADDKIICSVDINAIKIIAGQQTKTVFQNLHVQFESGFVYAILGKNGTGKTTLLNSISKLLDEKFYCIEGNISVGHNNVLACSDEELQFIRKNIVRNIFQDPQNLFDPLKKVGYYFQDSIAADKNKLDELFDYFLLPNTERVLDFYPHELSIGMAQRVAFILGFISEPKLLLLDEPNSSLDLPISNLLSQKLVEFARKKLTCIVFTTQDINFAIKTADKIILLKNSGSLEYYNSSADQEQLKKVLIENLN